MNKFDSHVVLFEKWILDTSMRMTGFVIKESVVDIVIRSTRPFKNRRLLQFLYNDEVDFYKGNKPYKKRYE